MRKITIAIISLLLVAVMAFPVSAAGSASLKPSAGTVYRGDTFTVAVNVSGTAAGKAGSLAVTYNKQIFELLEGSSGISGVTLVPDLAAGRFIFYAMQDTNLNGTIVTLKFKVKSDAAFSSQVIDATVDIGGGMKASATVIIGCRHSFGSWKKVDGNNHSRTCTVCKEVETKAHRYDNACDTSCNDCGHTRTIKHNFSTKWSSNGQYHWHGCTVCGAWNSDSAAHTPGDPATEQHAQNCTVCGYELAPQLEHVHVPILEWLFDEVGHWYACERCEGKAELADHDFTAECDSICDTCGFERETVHTPGKEWVTDETGHWHVCQVCQEIVDKTAHVSDEDPAAPKCADCGFDLLHTHVFGTEWSTDGENHWHGCACGEKQELAAHDWDDGALIKAPTAQEKGEMLIRCLVCGAEHKAMVMAMEVEKPSLQGLLYWQIACGVLALLLVVALIFFIVVIAKISKKPKGKFAGR